MSARLTLAQSTALSSLIALRPGDALFRPSSIDRTMACAGSVGLSRRVAVAPGRTVPQAEGSAAHYMAELGLKGERQPIEWADRTLRLEDPDYVLAVTEEMVEGAEMHVSHVRSLITDPAQQFLAVEYKLSLQPIQPDNPLFGENRGTGDAVILDYVNRRIVIVDLKFGRGVMVKASSPQLRNYALMAYVSFPAPPGGWLSVETHVVQPRSPDDQQRIKIARFTIDELLAFTADLYNAFLAALEPNPALVTGDHCGWCPARAICPALAFEAQQIARDAFSRAPVLTANHFVEVPREMPALPDPFKLTPEQMATILDRAELYDAFIKGVKQAAVSAAKLGIKIPGHKLTNRTGNRSWTDPRTAAETLKLMGLTDEQIYAAPKLLSPAQVEKLLPKAVRELVKVPDDGTQNPLVERAQGEPYLVLDSVDKPTTAPLFTPLLPSPTPSR